MCLKYFYKRSSHYPCDVMTLCLTCWAPSSVPLIRTLVGKAPRHLSVLQAGLVTRMERDTLLAMHTRAKPSTRICFSHLAREQGFHPMQLKSRSPGSHTRKERKQTCENFDSDCNMLRLRQQILSFWFVMQITDLPSSSCSSSDFVWPKLT